MACLQIKDSSCTRIVVADAASHGVDINGDGLVASAVEEAGAFSAYLQEQLMASLPLLPA